MPRKIEIAATVQAKREQHGFVALTAEVFQRKVTTETHVQAQFRPEVENFTNLGLQNVARQAVFWNAEMHHSARHRRGFKNGYGITEQGQIVRGRHAGGTRANNGDLFRAGGAWPFGKDIDGIPRFRSMALGDESLQGADGDGHVKLPAPTSGLTRMPAHAATDGGKRIGDPGVAVSFLVPPLRNERNVASGLRVDRTGLHAGEVRFEPLEVY